MRVIPLLLVCTLSCLGQTVRVIDMDEKVTVGKGIAVQGRNLVVTLESGEKKEIPCDTIVEITFPANTGSSTGKEPQLEVVLTNGDVVHGDVTGGDNTNFTLAAGEMGQMKISEDYVTRVLVLANKGKLPAGASAETDKDRVYFDNQDTDVGFANKLTPTDFVFDSQLKGGPTSVTYPWTKIAGWFLTGARPVAAPKTLIATIDCSGGTRLTGSIVDVDATRLTLDHVLCGKVPVPVAAIRAIYFVNGRVTYLSDLKPVAAHERPLVTTPDTPDTTPDRPTWRPDVSVITRQPLKIKDREFRKGLGVHDFSALEFALGRNYRRFNAAVGLDQEAAPNGTNTTGGTALFQVYAGPIAQVDVDLFLVPDAVKDWKALCAGLVAGEKEAHGPAKRVWERIPAGPEARPYRKTIEKGADGSDLSEEDKRDICWALDDAMDDAMAKAPLYDAQDFPDDKLAPEAKDILKMDAKRRTWHDTARLNRRLLEAACGKEIAPLPPPPRLLWESGVMKYGDEAKEVMVDVSGLDSIVLVVRSGVEGDILASDSLSRADWGGARLIR